MSAWAFFAADATGPSVPGVVRSSGVAVDLLLVLGAGLLLFGLLVVWAAYFRRQRSRHRHRHHRHHRSSVKTETATARETAAEAGDDEEDSRHHRRRRRRREHRGRNPTLAETGGLPPPRPNGAMPPAP